MPGNSGSALRRRASRFARISSRSVRGRMSAWRSAPSVRWVGIDMRFLRNGSGDSSRPERGGGQPLAGGLAGEQADPVLDDLELAVVLLLEVRRQVLGADQRLGVLDALVRGRMARQEAVARLAVLLDQRAEEAHQPVRVVAGLQIGRASCRG